MSLPREAIYVMVGRRSLLSRHSKGIELVYAKSLGRYKILFKTSDEVLINRNFTDYIPKSSTYGFP